MIRGSSPKPEGQRYLLSVWLCRDSYTCAAEAKNVSAVE
jgi:hypothetical protein